jgi:hypothetical protein
MNFKRPTKKFPSYLELVCNLGFSLWQMHEEAVKLYAELAATAMASFISSKDAPLMEPVQLNVGFEESRETLKKFRGEDDDDFQFLEYQVCMGGIVFHSLNLQLF